MDVIVDARTDDWYAGRTPVRPVHSSDKETQ
jgi:hypothetical protein